MPKRPLGSEDSDDDLQASSSDAPVPKLSQAKKRRYVEFEPVRICSIGSVSEIDNRVLRTQHYKLCERFRYKQKIQQELEKRIEDFERRQVQEDAVNCIINRYWNQLDANMQNLLQRFDEEELQLLESDIKEETNNHSQQERHFLNLLAQWSCEELDDKLKQRIEFSQRIITKLLQTYTRIGKKNNQICNLLKGIENSSNGNKPNSENSPPGEESEMAEDHKQSRIDEELRKYAVSVFEENARLSKLTNKLQLENHRLNIQTSSHDDKTALLETRVELLNNELEDLRCQLRKSMRREEKLDYRLAEYVKKEKTLQMEPTAQERNFSKDESQNNGNVDKAEELTSLSKAKLIELQQDLEIQTELANNRLNELQELIERNKSLSAELESCKMKLKYISSDDVKNSTEYRCLQTMFSSLFEDCKLQRKENEELKQQIIEIKQSYEDQINSMKADEASALDRLEQTVSELDKDLNIARKEYENVCVEYEVNTISREQAAPIHEQVNSLMNSLSTQNVQLKQEVARLKRKCQEAMEQLNLCQKEMEGERRLNNDGYLIIKLEDNVNTSITSSNNETSKRGSPLLIDIKKEEPTDSITSQNGHDEQDKLGNNRSTSASRPSTPSDLADAQTIIQRLTLERDRYKEKLRQIARIDLKEKRKQWTDEQKRKQKQLEEQCERLRRELQSAKQEEDGLMQEMESTGQAFEDLQEQNKKLLDQLREKEEVNLRLMSERIKSTQAQKKMKDEKELLDQTIHSLENQLAAKMLLCQKLEEKERITNEHRITVEHEIKIREQNHEALKKKATESTQLATDLKLRLDRLDVQFNELRENVIKKASTHEADANKVKRLEEEKNSLKRKLDRAKKMEKFENIDQVLQEENRILRESLTCSSCKVRRINAILNKCHHVFCFECIRQRYDNRRRKCPKCNAAFGANDYNRIFID